MYVFFRDWSRLTAHVTICYRTNMGVIISMVLIIFCFFKKFIYSEKATTFCEISTLLLTTVHTVKSKLEISQNCVAFSEFMNFKCSDLVIYTAFIFFTDSVFIILCPFQLSTFFGLFWLMNHEACPKLIMADHHFVPFFLCLVAIYSKYPFLSWDRLKRG